jgi:hypothetical protein
MSGLARVLHLATRGYPSGNALRGAEWKERKWW